MELVRDSNLKVSKALPAAGASATYSDSIDLIDSAPGVDKMDDAQMEIAIPALPALADAKTATFTIQSSADNVTFADHPSLAPLVLTGAGGAGAAAATRLYPFPKDIGRYIRIKQAVQSAGGDNTAKSSVFSVVF